MSKKYIILENNEFVEPLIKELPNKRRSVNNEEGLAFYIKDLEEKHNINLVHRVQIFDCLNLVPTIHNTKNGFTLEYSFSQRYRYLDYLLSL